MTETSAKPPTPPAPSIAPRKVNAAPPGSGPGPRGAGRSARAGRALPWWLVLGSAALFFLAYGVFAGLAKSNYGPQVVAAGFDSVWVYSQGELWRLRSDGSALARYDGGLNGVGKVVDGLVALAPDRLALRDFDAKAWRGCRAGESGVALECGELLPREFARHAGAESAIALAPDGMRWVFADFDAGELLLFDRDKTLLTRGRGVKAPDGGTVLWLGPQEIGLFGADRATLYTVELSPAGLSAPQPRWDVTEEGVPARGFVWSAAQLAGGKLWYVVYSAKRRATHQLWRIDRDGRRGAELALGNGGEPAQVVALDRERLLVPDVVSGRVHLIAAADQRLTEFGDARFREALQEAKKRHFSYQLLAQISLVLLVLVPLSIGGFFAIRQARIDAAEQMEALDLPPLEPGTEFWFTPDERQFALRERLILLLGLGLALVSYLEFKALALVLKLDPRLTVGIGTLLVLAVATVTAWLWWRQHQRGPRSLGLRDREVLFDRGDGQTACFPLEGVLTDGKRLLLGRDLLPLRSEGFGIRAEWNVSELFSYLVKELPANAYRSGQQLQWTYLRRNPWLLALSLGPLALAMLIMVLVAVLGVK